MTTAPRAAQPKVQPLPVRQPPPQDAINEPKTGPENFALEDPVLCYRRGGWCAGTVFAVEDQVVYIRLDEGGTDRFHWFDQNLLRRKTH